MNRIAGRTALLATFCAAALVVGCSSPNLPPGENGTTAGGNGNFGANPDRPGDYQHPDMQGQGSPPKSSNPNENSPTPVPQGGGGM